MTFTGNTMEIIAMCADSSHLAVGGGYATPVTHEFEVYASYPHFSGSGWTVVLKNVSGPNILLTTFVRCAELG